MKQGKSYFTVILWILLAAIAAYFGYNVVSSLYAPLMTATVTPYEAGAGYYASGFVVREEELLYSQYGTTVLNCAEGAHVAANDAVATGYRSEDAKTRQTRIDELSGQIEQLQYAWSAVSSVYDQAALDADIAGDLAQLSRYLALRDMNSVSDLSPELKGLILRRTGSDSDSGSLQARISTLQAELETLEAQSAGDTSAILAGKAGTFSAAVDGYESVLTPERLMEMTVTEFESVQPDETDANAIGRLVTSATWYYACVVPASELSGVEEGDRATLTFPARNVAIGEPLMKVEHMCVKKIQDVSFCLREGEVLGIFGLMGAGRTELVESIFGVHKITGGSIEIKGKPVAIHSPEEAIRAGIAYVPSERKQDGLILSHSVKNNMTLANLRKYNRGYAIDSAAETAAARGWVDTLDIKTPGLGAAVDTLSGGNQQKVVIAKWLDTAPQILILNEPTRGVDVGAKVEIYNTLELMCKKKIGVIMISSELPEIMAIADRIIVIHEGRYMGECLKQDISQERLLSMAIGG